MKRTNLIHVFLTLAIAFSAVGDVYGRAEPGFKFGYQSESGFKAGAFYTFNLGAGFALQPELLFSQRKYDYSYFPCYYVNEIIVNITDFMKEGKDNVRYLEVPVLIKYRFNWNGNFKPVLFAGGYTGFRISRDKIDDQYCGLTYREYNTLDAGFIFGAGFEHQIGNMKMHYEFRYTLGMVDIQKNRSTCYEASYLMEEDFWTPEKRKNRSFAVMVGVSF